MPRDQHRKRRTKGDILDDARRDGRAITLEEGRRLFAPTPATEHGEQVDLAAWVRASVGMYPLLANFTAIPNAEQSKAQAGKKWAEGVQAGYPDTLLDQPKLIWHGLRIELKRSMYWRERTNGPVRAGEPTDRQVAWHHRLTKAGYLVWVCWGWEPARDVLIWYHGLPEWSADGQANARALTLPDIPRTRVYTLSQWSTPPDVDPLPAH